MGICGNTGIIENPRESKMEDDMETTNYWGLGLQKLSAEEGLQPSPEVVQASPCKVDLLKVKAASAYSKGSGCKA